MSDTCRLLLVRHGESQWNAAGILQGQRGPGLSPLGRRQAERTAAWLAAQQPQPSAIVASDLVRATQTAAPASELLGLPVDVDSRLREIDLGTWSGRTRAEVATAEPEAMAAWLRGEDIARGGGESLSQLRDRVWPALAEVAERWAGQTVLVFTHGGPVRVAVATVLGLPVGGLSTLAPVGNCSVSALLVTSGEARLASYNELAHHAA